MRKKLSSQIADEISSLINTEFPPGSKIPTEDELCKRFDVSRTTIREAIKELCSLNVLVIKRGVGTFVDDNPGMIDDPFGWKYVDNETFIPAMWETSFIIEPEMTYLAAQRATTSDIELLKSIQESFKEYASKFKESPSPELRDRIFYLDGQFHYCIATASGNVILQSFYRSYRNIIEQQIPADNGPKIIDCNLFYHDLLIKNIENREPEIAKETMRLHDAEVKRLSLGE